MAVVLHGCGLGNSLFRMRQTLLRYAIGFDLVVVAVGIALLLPEEPGVVFVPFLAAVGLAATRGGWRVGLATTVFSLVALFLTFAELVPNAQLLLFTIAGVAASVLLDERTTPHPPLDAEIREAQRIAATFETLRARAVPALMYLGLPALVLLVYLNLSSVLVAQFGIPSTLQPLLLLLAGTLLLCRDQFRPASAVLMPLTVALTAYVLIAFTSSNWARDAAATDRELTDLAKSVMLLLVTGAIAASWRALRGALIALVAGAVLLSVLTLIQVAIGDPTLQFGGLAEADQGHLYGEVSQLRPAGPVGDANYLARILILAVPAAAFLGIGRSRRTELAFMGAAGVISLAILFTYSRGGMLSLAAVGGLLLLAQRIRLTKWNVAAGVLLLLALLPTNVGKRLLTLESLLSDSEATVADASVEKRRQLLSIAGRMFADRPLAGVGIGNFGAYFAPYSLDVGLRSLDFTEMGVRQFPHNLYLEMLVETGLLGVLAFVFAMAVGLTGLFRARRTLLARGDTEHAALVTAIAIGLAGYLLSSVFLHSGLHRYLWMFLGLVLAAIRLTRDDSVATVLHDELRST
jgi:putative inorganic carbon (hco3(-)) transporter